MRFWSVVTLIAIVVIGSLTQATDVAAASATDSLPSLADLEHLNYTPTNNTANPLVAASELRNIHGLFWAYSAGLDAILKYREPVATRGASGISVFKAVAPAVVVVVVGSIKNDKFDPEGMGTGVIIDPRGYVLTNWHVINGYQDAAVALKPAGNSDIEAAKVCVGKVVYQDQTTDLALLKLLDPPSNLHSVVVADIAQVQVAEDIHVIGHPHGNLWSYSTGVVSQIRDEYKWSYSDGSKHESKVLQLQTAINPGNSGGPVVDDTGKILGLVAMSEEGQNLDYAIAADVIKRFLFTGMHMNTRGMKPSSTQFEPARQTLVATLTDSTAVTKFVYGDVVLYSVAGKSPGLVAKFGDGTELRAWDQTASDTFKSWSVKLPQGIVLRATGSAGTVTNISTAQ